MIMKQNSGNFVRFYNLNKTKYFIYEKFDFFFQEKHDIIENTKYQIKNHVTGFSGIPDRVSKVDDNQNNTKKTTIR